MSEPVPIDIPAAVDTGVAIAGLITAMGQAMGQVAPTHRQCFIMITNECSSFSLSSPRWYTHSGSCASPFPPTIRSHGVESALFMKTPNTACGSIGVVTYDLLNNDSNQTTEKIALMFSNPYDFNLYSNWYAVGVFDMSKECDENLYNEMYQGTSDSFIRSKADGKVLSYRGSQVTIKATMSDAYQPVMKVELSENK
uniref:DELTA-sagatoxin-Srs1a n=1 Tax=Salarias fasciatus TaxID=181472 RepID=A0A672G299_SALFA